MTARRVQERLQDVPISITTFNQQQLESRNIVTAADLATYTPSLQANNFFGSEKTEFSIRGFVQDIGTAPSVGVYFADVVAPRGASVNVPAGDGTGPGSLFDLENVQVLKGPQGTLFGRNTTGGAVLLVPRKPTDKVEGYVEASYGDFNMGRIQAVFNAPLGDKVRFRVGVDHMSQDGYLTNDSGIGPSRFDDVDYTAVRGSLVVDITPTLENYSIFSYSDDDSTGSLQKLGGCDPAVGLGALACAQLAGAAGRGDGFYTLQNVLPHAFDKETQWQIINTTTWRVSDALTVKNIISYAQLTEQYSSDVFGTLLDAHLAVPSDPPGTYVGIASVEPVLSGNSADQSTFTEEFRLQGDALDRRLDYQGGVYSEVSRPLGPEDTRSEGLLSCSDLNAPICNNPLGAGSYAGYNGLTSFYDLGLYAQGSYRLTDKLKLTGGFRYTWDRDYSHTGLPAYLFPFGSAQQPPSVTYCQEPGPTPPTCQVNYRQSSSKPTWLIDLDYKPTNDILLYAKYARGYRAGGVTPNAPAQYAIFQPESVDSYEGGFKTTFRVPVRGTFDVSAFYNDLSNQQLLVLFAPKPGSTLPPISGIANAGKSELAGVEASATITPFRGLTFEGAYTYLYTDLERVSLPATAADAPYDIAPSQEQGDPLPFAPHSKFTLSGTYVLPLDSAIGEVSFGPTYIHTDRTLTNYNSRNAAGQLNGFSYVNPTDLLNVNASWTSIERSNVDLFFFMTNATGEKYYTVFAPLINVAGFASGSVGAPRMFGVRVRYHFG